MFLYVPPGVYPFQKPLVTQNVFVVGAGADVSIFDWTANAAESQTPAWTFTPANLYVFFVFFFFFSLSLSFSFHALSLSLSLFMLS